MNEVFVDSTTTAKSVCGADIAIVLNYEIGYADRGSDLCRRSHRQNGLPRQGFLSPERDSEMGLSQFNPERESSSPERDSEMGLSQFNPERDSSKESHTRIKQISF